jgi:repressor LexA
VVSKENQVSTTRKVVEKTQHPVHERLSFLIERLAGGIQARFAERVGVPTGTIGDILGKKKSKPGFELTGKILQAYPEVSERWLLTGEGEMLKSEISDSTQEISSYPPGQTNVQAVGLLSEIPVIKLRRVSFKARASFGYMQMQRFKESDIFDTLLFRLPPGRTEEDYKDALVFDIEGDSMEPSLRDGQQVIAWPVSDSRWEYLHNTICVVDYAEEVTVKAILKNDLNNTEGLTLHATGGAGGSFTVARKDIHSIWEVREFYGVVPVRLLP